MGRTRKDAQQQAAENALRSLAGKCSSQFQKCILILLFLLVYV